MPHVYLLSNRPKGTLYLGVTEDLGRRVYEHKTKAHPGFTATYGVDRLVWMEWYDSIVEAIAPREDAEELAAGLEGRADRGDEPDLGRSLRNPQPVMVLAGRHSRIRTGVPRGLQAWWDHRVGALQSSRGQCQAGASVHSACVRASGFGFAARNDVLRPYWVARGSRLRVRLRRPETTSIARVGVRPLFFEPCRRTRRWHRFVSPYRDTGPSLCRGTLTLAGPLVRARDVPGPRPRGLLVGGQVSPDRLCYLDEAAAAIKRDRFARRRGRDVQRAPDRPLAAALQGAGDGPLR